MKIIEIIKKHLKFIDTITTKLLTLVLFVTVIPLMVVANFSTGIINQSMLDSEKNELNYSILLFKQKNMEKLNSLKLLINQAASLYINDSYNKYLSTGNENVFLNNLLSLKSSDKLDFCFLIDNNNNIFIDQNKFSVKQTEDSMSKLIKQGFQGKTVTSTEVLNNKTFTSINDQLPKTFNSIGLSELVVAPIKDKNNQIKAVLVIGKSLINDKELPYVIKSMTGASLSIYQIFDNEPRVITTNINLSDKNNFIKDSASNDFLKHIKSGESYLKREQQILGFEIGQYEPIKNFSGNIIGATYLGIPESKFIEPGSDNIKLVSLISVISLIVSIVIAALFARTITTPILKLVIAERSIASGFLHHRVSIKGNDEIAQLYTTFNQMADNLQKQEQLRDNFVATLTHDLKVPMLAENQTVNYLIKETYGPITEEQKQVLELIKSTNASSLEMVSTLLEVYRYDSGNANLLKTEFDIVKLAHESIDQIKSLAQDKKIVISLNTNREEIFITADEREIKRVLHNLISNAITNGIHHGQILCTIELIQGENVLYYPKTNADEYTTLTKPRNLSNNLLISIKDDGVGITREDIIELFKRFSLSKGRKPAGTGLGLYYSYQVITKHKGYIWAESAEGKGSTFKFTLPIQV